MCYRDAYQQLLPERIFGLSFVFFRFQGGEEIIFIRNVYLQFFIKLALFDTSGASIMVITKKNNA